MITSCNDDAFLREKPEDFLTTENGFLNVRQFQTGVNQMYAQVRALYNSNDGDADWIMMGVGTDVFMTPRGNGYDCPFNDWKRVDSFNGVASRWWNACYGIIKNCNELLYQTEIQMWFGHRKDRKKKFKLKFAFSVPTLIVV